MKGLPSCQVGLDVHDAMSNLYQLLLTNIKGWPSPNCNFLICWNKAAPLMRNCQSHLFYFFRLMNRKSFIIIIIETNFVGCRFQICLRNVSGGWLESWKVGKPYGKWISFEVIYFMFWFFWACKAFLHR